MISLSLFVFVLELAVLFPWFRAGGFRHWDFDDLGAGPGEIALSLATRPDRAATLLVDHPQKRRSLLLPLAATGLRGHGRPCHPAPAAAELGRALPLLASHALVGLLLRDARGGDGAGGRHPGSAPAAGGRPRRSAPGRVRRHVRVDRRRVPALQDAGRRSHQPALHAAAALRRGRGGRPHPGRRRALHRPRSAPQGRRPVPPASPPGRPAVHLRARSRGRRGCGRAAARRRDLARGAAGVAAARRRALGQRAVPRGVLPGPDGGALSRARAVGPVSVLGGAAGRASAPARARGAA